MRKYLLLGICALCMLCMVVSCGKRNIYVQRVTGDQKPPNTIDSFLLIDPSYVMGSYTSETGTGGSVTQSARVATITVSKLTQKILNAGSVNVAVKINDGLYASDAPYGGLPYRFDATSGGYFARVATSHELGKIKIYYFFEQPVPGGTAPPGLSSVIIPTYLFRYTIVPGPDGY